MESNDLKSPVDNMNNMIDFNLKKYNAEIENTFKIDLDNYLDKNKNPKSD